MGFTHLRRGLFVCLVLTMMLIGGQSMASDDFQQIDNAAQDHALSTQLKLTGKKG